MNPLSTSPVTIPHFPFRPETLLFPHHEAVQRYHADIIQHFNLTSHVRFFSRVVETRWDGAQWDVIVENINPERDAERPDVERSQFDHLIVANGHYHYPHEAEIEGLDAWRARADKHIVHSMYFRHGEDYAGQNVLVIGGGSSGRDSARQISKFANSVRLS
jgi:cation diffusion facilitator CzcD-associated flavoprotein CzcO